MHLMMTPGCRDFFYNSSARRWLARLQDLWQDAGAMASTEAVTEPGRRIAVVGTSGSGKSYVANALAAKLGLPYISGDSLIWAPSWQEVPRAERLRRFDAATSSDGWTIDTNLGSSAEDALVLERCDTLVWLDLPRWQVWSQVIERTLRRVMTRELLWHGNVETWRRMLSRDSIIWWSLKTYGRRRRAYRASFADPALNDKVRIQLRSRSKVNRWLAQLGELSRPQGAQALYAEASGTPVEPGSRALPPSSGASLSTD